MERLGRRLDDARAGRLPSGQNPGFDRLAEARYLLGRWDEAKASAAEAARHWRGVLSAKPEGPGRLEPTFHLGSSLLFADDLEAMRDVFTEGVARYVDAGMAASDDTGYMATVTGEWKRARVVFQAAAVADMGAQGMSDLARFEARFPDTPRLLKMRFVEGLEGQDAELIGRMLLMERWLTPEAEGVSSFRTEEWFYAAHQVALARLARGEAADFRLYDGDVEQGLRVR